MVKIKKDSGNYIAYFPELRKFVFVNKKGSNILDLYFNSKLSMEKIAEKLKIEQTKVSDFLKDIKETLKRIQYSLPVPEKGFFDTPISAEIQVSNSCNLRCKHCFQSSYSEEAPYSEIDKRMKILSDNSIFLLNLVGGELFLRQDALKIITRACDFYGFSTNIVTNATLIDDKMMDGLLKIKNKPALLISLEGIGEVNDFIRGKGVFDKVDKRIRSLVKKGFYVEISCTITSYNFKYRKQLIDYAKELNIPCNFNLFKPFKEEHKELTISSEDYFTLVKELHELQQAGFNIGYTNAAIEGFLNGNNRDVCRAGVSGVTIDVDGYVLPCALIFETDYYDNIEMPFINQDFAKTWQEHEIFKSFRKGDLKECQACSYLFSGDLAGFDPYGLKAFKKYVKVEK